jgi:hypothetical protein
MPRGAVTVYVPDTPARHISTPPSGPRVSLRTMPLRWIVSPGLYGVRSVKMNARAWSCSPPYDRVHCPRRSVWSTRKNAWSSVVSACRMPALPLA